VASNGVVHVIDTVLIPLTTSTSNAPTPTINAPTPTINAPTPTINAPTQSTNDPDPSASSGASFGLISTVSAIIVAIGCSMLL
jgi:hypothetical protein